jgi:hypothetical protein
MESTARWGRFDRGRSSVDYGPALASLWAGFFRLGLFREILRELFVNLGGNWSGKSSISREIRGIGARKFVDM